MRTFAYTRKSTDDGRQPNSHRVQREAITAWANGRYVEFVEEDGSATRRKLPERDRLVASLREGDVLVTARLDRLARSAIDLGHILEVALKKGWKLVVLDQEGMDMTSPLGECFATIAVALARFESRRMGERISGTMRQLQAEGRRFGARPTIPARVRREIVTRYGRGEGCKQIAHGLNARRVPTVRGKRWYHTTVLSVLRQEGVAIRAT